MEIKQDETTQGGFRKILVPVDGSGPSRRALDKAVYLASLCDAELTLLNVVDLNKEISSFEQVSTGGYVPSELKESGYQLLAELMHVIPREIRAKAAVEIGAPPQTTVEYYERHGFDIIVIGSRGIGKLKQIIMGSVSQYVLLRASCPVLIVK